MISTGGFVWKTAYEDTLLHAVGNADTVLFIPLARDN
jgi:hypothetical protein